MKHSGFWASLARLLSSSKQKEYRETNLAIQQAQENLSKAKLAAAEYKQDLPAKKSAKSASEAENIQPKQQPVGKPQALQTHRLKFRTHRPGKESEPWSKTHG
jgi:hypothetical protein